MKKITLLLVGATLASFLGCAVEYEPGYGHGYGHRYGYERGYRSDAEISAAVQSQLDAQGLRNIDVSTSRGTVYLRGVVRDADTRRYAARVATSTQGVDRVVNNIELGRYYRSGDAPDGWEPKGPNEYHYHPWVDGH